MYIHTEVLLKLSLQEILKFDKGMNSRFTTINTYEVKEEKDTFGKASLWIDFYGKRGDSTEGLAILQHPSNPWY